MSISSALGTCTAFNVDRTASGSVGLMRAPNTKAQAKRQARCKPRARSGEAEERGGVVDEGYTGPGAIAQAEVNMQGAGEKQEGQHTVEHGRLKIDLSDDPREIAVQMRAGHRELYPDEHQRGRQVP